MSDRRLLEVVTNPYHVEKSSDGSVLWVTGCVRDWKGVGWSPVFVRESTRMVEEVKEGDIYLGHSRV